MCTDTHTSKSGGRDEGKRAQLNLPRILQRGAEASLEGLIPPPHRLSGSSLNNTAKAPIIRRADEI
jgi:hypothetical protein